MIFNHDLPQLLDYITSFLLLVLENPFFVWTTHDYSYISLMFQYNIITLNVFVKVRGMESSYGTVCWKRQWKVYESGYPAIRGVELRP